MRVLIIDDSSTARLIIKKCIEIAVNIQVDFLEAENGESGWGLLRNERVDLIITDLNMPKMDGRTFLRQLQASPRLNSIPVLVITSLENQSTQKELCNLGAKAVVGKPLSPAKIKTALMESLGKDLFDAE